MKPSSIFNTRKSTTFQTLCLRRVHQHPKSNESLKKMIGLITTSQSYRAYDGISGERAEFEWNIFPGFTTLHLRGKVTDLLSRLGETPELSQEEFYLCRCSMTFLVTRKTMKKNVWQMLRSSLHLQKKFGFGQWSFIVPGSEKKWYSMEENSPKRNLRSYRGKNTVGIRRKRMSNFPCNDSIVQV